MSKKNQTQVEKPDERHPSAQHVSAIGEATHAALLAEAAVGRGLLELLNLATAASQANQATQAAHIKALMSVGIDPNGVERWSWDPAKLGYVKG